MFYSLLRDDMLSIRFRSNFSKLCVTSKKIMSQARIVYKGISWINFPFQVLFSLFSGDFITFTHISFPNYKTSAEVRDLLSKISNS